MGRRALRTVHPTCAFAARIEGLFIVSLQFETRCAQCNTRAPHDVLPEKFLLVPFPKVIGVVYFPRVGAPSVVPVVVGTSVDCVLRLVSERSGEPACSLVCAKCVMTQRGDLPGHLAVLPAHERVGYGESVVVVPVAAALREASTGMARASPPAKKPRVDDGMTDVSVCMSRPAGGDGCDSDRANTRGYWSETSLWEDRVVLVSVLVNPAWSAGSAAALPERANVVMVMAVAVPRVEPHIAVNRSELFLAVVSALGARFDDLRVALFQVAEGGEPVLLQDEDLGRIYEPARNNYFAVLPEQAAAVAVALPELSLPSGHAVLRLEACIAAMLSEEELEEDERWNCPQCEHKERSFRSMRVAGAPCVLVVHLKRFLNDSGRITKLDVPVVFPVRGLLLDGKTYDLAAVSSHYGSTPLSGHYKAVARNFLDGNWYCFDDELVTVCAEDDLADPLIQREAYVLFYVSREYESRVELPPEPR